MQLTRLLAFRLFVILFVVMALGTSLLTTLNVQWQTNRYERMAIATTARVSDVIKRSTHYSMLLNRREDIYNIINTIGNEPGIEAIRIYNKAGIISYSTESEEVGSRVDMKAEGCNACHEFDKPPAHLNRNELTRIFASPRGYRILGMITPIYNEESCATAVCHAHPGDQVMLGVLDVLIPLSDFDLSVAESTREQYTIGLLIVLAVSLLMGFFIWLMVNIPVRQLMKGTREIVKGNLEHRIPVRSQDEIGMLAQSFNLMTDEVRRARKEILEWTQTLEQRVTQKTEELRRAQQNMVYVEKMASLGQLAATVAHELNNPLEGILTYARLLQKRLSAGTLPEGQLNDVRGELTLIAEETARCGEIVKNLLLFAKKGLENLQEVDLRSVVERSIQLVEHHLKIHSIELILDIGEKAIPMYCNPQQIEQALLAMEINAVEAMPEGGKLTLRMKSTTDSGNIVITIGDTGYGISSEDLPHIFEPFFTTKEHGKGTGLGLAVAYGIIRRHGGVIDVTSTLNAGTTFTISLPAKAPTAIIGTEVSSHAYG